MRYNQGMTSPELNADAPALPMPSRRRFALALLLAATPSLVVYIGLNVFHSAIAAFLLYHSLCLVGGLLLRAAAPARVARRFPINTRHLVLFALLTGIVVNAATYFLYPHVVGVLLDAKLLRGAMAEYGLPPSTYRYLFPYFALVNPTVEEFFWRGALYPLFRQRLSDSRRATLLTAAFFAVWHYLPARVLFPPSSAFLAVFVVFLAGILLTSVYEQTHHLGWPITLHALAADIPLLLLLSLLQR